MSMIVNLNKYRKERKRDQRERLAAQNRVRFGRSKTVRDNDALERVQAKKSLDDKRLE
jgi:Domain of unknown function (DUF4169)